MRVTFATYGALYVSELDANRPEEFHVNFYSFGTAYTALRVSRRDVFPDPCDQTSIIAPAHPGRFGSAPRFARAGLPWS